jgi:YfiH family protein
MTRLDPASTPGDTAPAHAPLRLTDCIVPDWQVAPRVKALVTTRAGGVSAPPYGAPDRPGGLNLGLHSGDDPRAVHENRHRVLQLTGTSAAWLDQVHGTRVVLADEVVENDILNADSSPPKADASVTAVPGAMCIVMVADCMPVLLCDAWGRAVGAAHAGWRGLLAGVIEHTVGALRDLLPEEERASADLRAFLGPSIGPGAFEVGAEVRAAFLDAALPAERDATRAAFVQGGNPVKYFGDLAALARLRLARVGVTGVTGGAWCTVADAARFYSFRRDRVTGRMAAMVWIEP